MLGISVKQITFRNLRKGTKLELALQDLQLLGNEVNLKD
jgi:hypothetical protein